MALNGVTTIVCLYGHVNLVQAYTYWYFGFCVDTKVNFSLHGCIVEYFSLILGEYSYNINLPGSLDGTGSRMFLL